MNRIILLLVLTLNFSTSYPQKLKRNDRKIVESLEKNIAYLADDRLEGRRAGTEGEKAAYEFIISQFKAARIPAKGTDGYLQQFEINDGKKINNTTFFKVDGKAMQVGKDFFPLAFSASMEVAETPVAISLSESGVPWFKDIDIVLDENEHNPHFDIYEYIRKEAVIAKEKGATALVIFNNENKEDNIRFNGKDKSETAPIPVLYLTREGKAAYLKEAASLYDIGIKVALGEARRTGHNVIGYIDNKASSTIVIGAHYDHLGYGEDGNSMLREGAKQVHNGADDNASGTAALIELGKILVKSKKARGNNYLLIAFSGEELGLLGSKYFSEHPTVDLSAVNYMINMDMVGRIDDKNTVTIGGYGTSPTWGEVVHAQSKVPFTIKVDSSGTGPSDHTSFYRKNIPVLFFFTGTHSDYHKPSDDADKINYTGTLYIVRYINTLIESVNKKGKLQFTPTREVQTGGRTSFSVTLGIMPDYSYSGAGVKADGVSDGRPAKKAGIRQGDVITRLGDFAITSMETYMQALNKFKKGDKTKVVVKRGSEELSFDISF